MVTVQVCETDAQKRSLLSLLSTKSILECLKGALSISRAQRQSKELLIERVIQDAPTEHLHRLLALGQVKLAEKEKKGQESRKRKRDDQDEENSTRRVAQRLQDTEDYEPSKFLAVPTEEEVKNCYGRFYHATSNTAVEMSICGVCARECSVVDDQVKKVLLSNLPNTNRLIPTKSHSAQQLFDGKLLEPTGVMTIDDQITITICHACHEELKKPGEKPPKFSLANRLWIGPIPWQLQVLTFPEQLLIALLYPRVYVFKLFPKRYHGARNVSGLQRAMRGNVSTYELNAEGIASMVEGKLMPRPPAILASLISVTFIAVGELPKSWIHSTFRVRRQVVFEALQWLKRHNSKYYGNIDISAQRIQNLPEDDVPEEITSLIRQSEDTGVVDQESEGYIPPDDNEGEKLIQSALKVSSHRLLIVSRDDLDEHLAQPGPRDSEAADVIPLQVSGAVDTDMSTLTANELMMWGLANLWKEGKEGGYAVRHGKQPVCDFGRPRQGDAEQLVEANPEDERPNFFEKAFPCLFPYGEGGIEGTQEITVQFPEHVRWLLQYHDRRFRRHETFPFVAFGIQQRRQVLTSARLQMQRKTFERDAHLLATITIETLQKAQDDEEHGRPISDPAIRLLRQHTHATGGRVTGSDQARYQLRSQIWATSIMLNPPSLWITINPCDLHDPIAQVFAGEHIDLDDFDTCIGPSKEKRAENISLDPYAAAKFFHFLIKTILETLVGVKTGNHRVYSLHGVFGHVSAYFGVVESQGRGSLHLHMLLWMKNAPLQEEMEELLKDVDFRQRVKTFIKSNLRAYLPGLESAESIKGIPNEVEVAYSRPPKPGSPDYDRKLIDLEQRVARSKNHHTCDIHRCLIHNKKGGLSCKRRAPFEKASDDFIHESGHWGPKRLYEFMNGWVPALTVNIRSNNDGKLLTNSRETINTSFYITGYQTKKQGRNFNMSAILAKGFAYHNQRSSYLESIHDQNRLLLFRLVHTINREQELAAPMVMSYLMGWGDTYRSHQYTTIYWSSFVSALFRSYPSLRRRKNVDENNGVPEER
jgi:hypothetical protein